MLGKGKRNTMMIELLTQLLELPDFCIIFDVKSENNEFWVYLKPKELPLSVRHPI
jgi:hypothetical protein